MRIDKDSLGEVKVPSNAYYGPFTTRAMIQYNVTGIKSNIQLINAYVMIKRAAASTNIKTNILNRKKGGAIIKACDKILKGEYDKQFVIDQINSGAGTALNMNVNEVIANIALEIIGKKKGQYEHINPNDHVNMSQSSNDTFPTAMNIAILNEIKKTIIAIETLHKILIKKSKEFNTFKKIGRTHLMDALPITLGSEFKAYAIAIIQSSKEIKNASKLLEYIALGGTAVGTGANTKKKYRRMVILELSRVSKIELKAEKNMQYSIQSRFIISNLSSAIKNVVLEINRIANDIRLMASGPVTGFADIMIEAVHAGSSIMPGKVNPSLAECMNMICYNIIGNDTTISYAVQSGQFELNVMMPIMLKCIMESMVMLKNFLPVFTYNLIDKITADKEKLNKNIEKSPVIVTLLAPKIGYLHAAELFKEALKTNKNIKELVLSRKLLTEKEFLLLVK